MANYIEFIVDKQIIRRFDNEAVVQDSQNYLSAMFTFTEESEGWEGAITAVFKGADGQAFNVLLDSEGMCLVPWEVLTVNYFDVSLFCGDLITANVVRVFTIKSGYEIGQESREPTPDVYSQIIERIDNIDAFAVSYENEDLGVENVGDALDVLAQGGGGGGGGVTPNIHMTAEVDATTGTPDVEVTKTGTLTNPIFNLAFSGLKGETGSQGPQGIQGIQGPTGPQGPQGEAGADGSVVSVTQTLSSGTKIAEVSVDGTVTNLYAPSGSGSASDFDKFCDNIDIDYAFDSATSTNYTVIRIYKDKLDGTKQFPFTYSPSNQIDLSALDLANIEDFCLIINAGFGSSSTYIDGVFIQNGVVINNSPTTHHVGAMPLTIDSYGNLGYAQANATGNELLQQGMVSVVCGFCPIIVDYAPVEPPTIADTAHFTQDAQRQIIGQFGNGDYCVITCEGRNFDHSQGWTIAEAQTICQKVGLKFAYNLDGGGSTETVIGKKQLNAIYEGTTGRLRRSFIIFNGSASFDPYAEKTLLSITATKTTTTYEVGDTLSTSDIVVTANYSDGTHANVTNSATINTSSVDMSAAGTYLIVVSYTEDNTTKTTNISIAVSAPSVKTLTSISATKTQTSYSVGDTLSTSDIVVTAHYSDSSSADVTSSATIDTSDVDMSAQGTYLIVISYSEDGTTETTSISISVGSSQRLPSGYTELQYVTANGNQYVDTGINETQCTHGNYKVRVTSMPAYNGNHILSSRNTYLPFLKANNQGATIWGQMLKGNNSPSGNTSVSWNIGTDYEIEGYVNGKVSLDGVEQSWQLTAGNTSSASNKLYLFAYGGGITNTTYYFHGYMYWCKMFDSNDNLLRHFIPCIDPNDVVGLYDLVTETFYHSGSGTELTAGPVVN